jgi:hypothetical protein
MEMTAAKLKELCKKDSLYMTPYLNDKLYLHYKGFRSIENLGPYTGLRVIWLEGNGLASIHGLEAQADMRTLYLHENVIERIENLEHMVELNTLNLSKNCIRRLEGLAQCTKLQTLLVAHNHLTTVEDVEHLRALPSLTTLDLQENRLEDPAVVDVLVDLPQLAVLYLMGNPCVKKLRHYRKVVVGRIKTLKYLDDRPVFDDERARCDAWYAAYVAEGEAAAMAAERATMERLKREKAELEERNFNAFAEFVRTAAEAHAQSTGEEIELDSDPVPAHVPGCEDDDEEEEEGEAAKPTAASGGGARAAGEAVAAGGGGGGAAAAAAVNPFSGEAIVQRGGGGAGAGGGVEGESEAARQYREERWQRIVEASDSFRADPAAAGAIEDATAKSGAKWGPTRAALPTAAAAAPAALEDGTAGADDEGAPAALEDVPVVELGAAAAAAAGAGVVVVDDDAGLAARLEAARARAAALQADAGTTGGTFVRLLGEAAATSQEGEGEAAAAATEVAVVGATDVDELD